MDTQIHPDPIARRPVRRRARFLVAVASAALALMAIGGAIAAASAPSGVVPTILARGSFDAFKVMSNPDNGSLFKAEAKAPIDMVVRRHEYAVGATTGWHAHPDREAAVSARGRDRQAEAAPPSFPRG